MPMWLLGGLFALVGVPFVYAKKAHLEVKRSTGAVILLGFGFVWLGIGALLLALSFA